MGDVGNRNVTILVVDDEECLLGLTRAILEQEGYQVLCAETAEEALQFAESHAGKINLLLTDMRMPKMDGITLSAEFRKSNPNSKVIYMTAFSPADVARLLPEETVLSKPFSPNQFCETIRDSLVSYA